MKSMDRARNLVREALQILERAQSGKDLAPPASGPVETDVLNRVRLEPRLVRSLKVGDRFIQTWTMRAHENPTTRICTVTYRSERRVVAADSNGREISLYEQDRTVYVLVLGEETT